MTRTENLYEAKTHLSALVGAAERSMQAGGGFHCTGTGPALTIFSFQPAAWPSSLNRLAT
jgi:hypothetical protein